MRPSKFKLFIKQSISLLFLLFFAIAGYGLVVNLMIREAYHPNADKFFFHFESVFAVSIIFTIAFIVNLILLFIKKSQGKVLQLLWGVLLFATAVILFIGHLIIGPQPDFITFSVAGKSYEVPRHFTASQDGSSNGVYLKIKGAVEKNKSILGVYESREKRKGGSTGITLSNKVNFSPFDFKYIMYTASSTSRDPYIKYVDKKVVISHVPDWLTVIEYEDKKIITNINDRILTFAAKNPEMYSAPDEVLNAFYYMEVDKNGGLLKFTSCRDLDSCEHHILYEDTVLSFSTYQDKESLPNNLPDLVNEWGVETKRVRDLIDSFEI